MGYLQNQLRAQAGILAQPETSTPPLPDGDTAKAAANVYEGATSGPTRTTLTLKKGDAAAQTSAQRTETTAQRTKSAIAAQLSKK